jgi:hypothetical protein
MLKHLKYFNNDFDLFHHLTYLSMKEGLIYSANYDIFKEKLNNLMLLYLDNDYFYIDIKEDKYISLYFDKSDLSKKNIFNLTKKITNLNNTLGYFISLAVDENGFRINSLSLKGGNNNIIFYFNKIFDIPENTPMILYHLTLKDFYDKKIKLKGLIPKSQHMVSNDLDRLYLSSDVNDIYNFITEKRLFLKKKYKNIEEQYIPNLDNWVILKIDLSSLPIFKLYKDTKMNNSYYTYDTIPFHAIGIEKEIKL